MSTKLKVHRTVHAGLAAPSANSQGTIRRPLSVEKENFLLLFLFLSIFSFRCVMSPRPSALQARTVRVPV
jgi:hypothetical protein